MTELLNHEKAVLRYNEETNAIELIWKQTQDEDTYKMMFTKGLEAVIERDATGWLSDIRKEGIVGAAASEWVQKVIIPKAIAHSLKKVAVVMDKDIYRQFYFKNVIRKTTGQMMHYFDSEEDAKSWLKETVLV